MENILELRCVLAEGAIAKQIMTAALILAAVEAGFILKCLITWIYNK